ncbi:hypothetical protein KCMC57_up62150 [Kitasatospora sp. CMC57]|uniref:Uncharacterized protein n=1 Tax=Kitasatospora sp. CMC57 TaxID=3231513 RepID=A0AB33KD84_9ACTN
MTPSRNEAFNQWLAETLPDPEIDKDPAWLSPQEKQWFEEIFDGNGQLPAHRLAEVIFSRRIQLAYAALDLLKAHAAGDLTTDLGELKVFSNRDSEYEPTGEVEIHGEQVRTLIPDAAMVTVAAAVQAFVADTIRRVWPVCGEHRYGLHPILTPTGARWHCRPGSHAIPLPGRAGRSAAS